MSNCAAGNFRNLFLLAVTACLSMICSIPANSQTPDATTQAAEQALAQGLAGKAARLYMEAWDSGNRNPEYALKAADLYTNKVRDLDKAVRLLREGKEAEPNGRLAPKFDAALAELQPTLRQAAETAVGKARSAPSVAEGVKFLEMALYADPTYLEIYRWRVRILSRGGEDVEVEDMIAALEDLAKLGLVSVEELGQLQNLPKWLEVPEFAQFVTDALGDSGLKKVIGHTPKGLQERLDQLITGWMNFAMLYNDENGYEKFDYTATVTSRSSPAPCVTRMTLFVDPGMRWAKRTPKVFDMNWKAASFQKADYDGIFFTSSLFQGYTRAQIQVEVGAEQVGQVVEELIQKCSAST